VIERRQPSCSLNRQKSFKNLSLSGRRFFVVRIFGLSRHKTEQILDGFASILTKKRRKSSDKKHSSDYFRHSEGENNEKQS